MEDKDKYLLTTDQPGVTGELQTHRLKEAPRPDENQAKDKVVDVLVLQLDKPVIFKDKDGYKYEVEAVQVEKGKASGLMFKDGQRMTIKGIFYKGHSVEHHQDVYVEADEAVKAK